MASLLNGILQADHSPGTKAGNLELRRDALGWRHWLDGRPVYAGSELEIDFFQEGWIPARYHWRFEIDRPAVVLTPFGELLLGPADRLRWPKRRLRP